MARWEQDPVDFACESWAFQWIDGFARLPVTGSQQLGRIGSTLDLIKLMGDGAGASSGVATQFFPEVFIGDGLVIACALKFMRERDREMVWHHYVDRWFFARLAPCKTAAGGKVFSHTTVVTVAQDRGDAMLKAEKTDEGLVRTYARAQFVGPGKPVNVRVVDCSRPDAHLVIERRDRPIKQQTMAERLGISRAEYYLRRDRVKAYLRGILDGPKCLDTKVGHETPVPV